MKNKYQEALDYIKHDLEHNDFIRYKNGNRVDMYHREVLRKLVGKETPMKLLKSQFDGYRECGNCNSIVVSTNYTLPNYCSQCGQKIDWGKDK